MSNHSSRASAKSTKKLIVAIVALIIVLAIVCCVLRFGFPATWDALFARIIGSHQSDSSSLLPEDVLTFSNGDLSVHMIDVGQGESLLILFPDGKDMLIDCANMSDDKAIKQRTLAYLNAYVPDGQLDYVMLTHGDADHVYFLDEVLAAFQVDNIFMPNARANPTSETWKNKLATLDDKRLSMFTDKDTITTACYAAFFYAAFTEPNCNVKLNVDPDENTNSIVIAGEGYNLTFYCPTKAYYDAESLSSAELKNAISPIGVLEYNGFRTVLTGDSNKLNEPTFVKRIGGKLDCDVLKVGHHGSASSTTPEFLDAITCEYAFISCNAAGNDFRHPRQAVLDRLVARDVLIYRTDNNGDVVFVFNTKITVYVKKAAEQSVNRQGLS